MIGVKELPFPSSKGIRERKRGLYNNGKISTTLIKCNIFFTHSNFRRSGDGPKGVFLLMINLPFSVFFNLVTLWNWVRGEKN